MNYSSAVDDRFTTNGNSFDNNSHGLYEHLNLPVFESYEKENIFHQLYEIFPNIHYSQLVDTLEECQWSMETAVTKLLDIDAHQSQQLQPPQYQYQQQQQSSRENMYMTNNNNSNNIHSPTSQSQSFQNFDERTLSIHQPQAKREVLPSDFLAVPKVRTVIVPPHGHLTPTDYFEYKVFFHKRDGSLDINVKLIDKAVRVCGLYSDPQGGPGLSELAGVQVGDVLFGINDEYFDSDVTLKQITTVISRSGQYVCLHFIRFTQNSVSFVINGQIRRVGQMRKIHPCALSLIDQGLLRVDDIEIFCEHLSRLKARIFSWSSGILTSRQRVSELHAAATGQFNESNTRDESYGKIDRRYEQSKKKRISRHSSSSSTSNIPSKTTHSILSTDPIAAEITKNWYRDIELMTGELQPALCMRIMDTRFIEDHVEYRIWVEDVSTGLEWYVRRRYKEFYNLREKLISIWPRLNQILFPARTTIAAGGSKADIVQERQPILEKFIRSIYQILVTEPLVHPLTREIYLLLYNFLDLPEYLPAIDSLVSSQSLAHGAYMNTLLFLTQDVTIEPSQLLTSESSQNDPLLYTRRFIEVYIHSILQLTLFSNKLIEKFIPNFQFQCHEFTVTNAKNENKSKEFMEQMLQTLSDFIKNLQEVLVVGMKEDILEIIEFLIHGNIQGRYSYHHASQSISSQAAGNINCPTSCSSSPPSSGTTTSSSSCWQSDEIILESIDGIRLRNDIIENISRIAIRRQIEKEVYIPCSRSLHDIIQQSFQPNEREFILKCNRLFSQPQTFYGIPPRNISPSSWEDIVQSLSQLKNQLIPLDRLQLLVRSAKSIPFIYSKEHQLETSSKSLGADDLLPIFIYCLLRSRLTEYLLILSQELDSLCDDEDRVSETGYYLATLQGAVSHLLVIDERVGDQVS